MAKGAVVCSATIAVGPGSVHRQCIGGREARSGSVSRPEQESGNRAPRRSPPRRRSSTRLMGLERSARPSCVWNGQRRRHAASRITSACSSSSTFRTTSSIVILLGPATRRLLSSTPWNEPTIIGAASAGTTFRPTSTYTTLRDGTRRCPDPAVERRWSGGGRESIRAHTGV